MITKDNVCWPSVESTCMERLEAIHLDLESASPERVTRLQGEAAALRWLLIQADPPPQPKTTPID
jgi:hypothetical protein